MSNDFSLTVGEILQSSHFKDTVLLAGASGLNSPVKWVHILELTDNIGKLVNGHELILTTGIGFKDEDTAIDFMKQLINNDISGLCIELGTYFVQIPDSMIKLAEEHQLPLIAFTKMTRFIDITHDLHTMIISRNSEMFSRVESYYQQLNDLLLSAHEFTELLSFTHQYLNLNVAYLSIHAEPIYMPDISSSQQKKFLNAINRLQATPPAANEGDATNESNIAGQSIVVLNHKCGDLYFFSEDRMLTEFDKMVLRKCAHVVAQDIARELYVSEKKNLEENSWIEGWLKGVYRENEIYNRLDIPGVIGKVSGYCIFMIHLDDAVISQNKLKELLIHATIITRPSFERNGFYILSCVSQNEIIFILFDRGNNRTWTDRVKQAIEEIKKNKHLFSANIKVIFGIGKRVVHVSEVHKSMETAHEAVSIQERLHIEEPIYEFLHIYRLISQLNKIQYLNDFIKDYLGPIIEYDSHNQSELLKTLKVFYECNCSKQKTAERLFIVRQTLYFRLQKIADLLGEDFMSWEKRLAIECAICSYDYLNS